MNRLIRPEDKEEWLALWEGYQRFYKAEIPRDVSEKTFERLLDPTEPMFAALAIEDGKALGLVHYIFHRSTWTTGDYCYLQDLFVAEGLRGKSLGRRLIDFVYSEAAKAGASRVYWLTHETNRAAMKLYDQVADRSGFLQYRKDLD
ncbi:GNAT family N-acetyltransferase [Aureimonas fodinaquatilis]|uniref:GNAT family N-acetyltransferase n=1 Tax=Aureimonas fodinaquatilis TaxID=2565783 RepID=A0A5B0DSK7_9HYPH|nr:GNAT family N-acetyltransferase [Aureimonas fodinaquatilis]KAA0968109.1 GNAT family N-acetyltransferase [Aureimonas fodinaquatilis]